VFSVRREREGIRRKQSVPWRPRTLSCTWVVNVGRLLGREATNLAPSHFSFSGFEPDEKRDILYPLLELVFSDRAKVE
jgi:hypothetical protein